MIDFEWDDIVDGVSEIAAGDLNSLAGGIKETQKELKKCKASYIIATYDANDATKEKADLILEEDGITAATQLNDFFNNESSIKEFIIIGSTVNVSVYVITVPEGTRIYAPNVTFIFSNYSDADLLYLQKNCKLIGCNFEPYSNLELCSIICEGDGVEIENVKTVDASIIVYGNNCLINRSFLQHESGVSADTYGANCIISNCTLDASTAIYLDGADYSKIYANHIARGYIYISCEGSSVIGNDIHHEGRVSITIDELSKNTIVIGNDISHSETPISDYGENSLIKYNIGTGDELDYGQQIQSLNDRISSLEENVSGVETILVNANSLADELIGGDSE